MDKGMQIALLTLLITVSSIIFSLPSINYFVLSQDVACGRTYTLYPGLFSIYILIPLLLMSFLMLNEGLLRYITIFLIFMWPMIVVLNFLLFGYVIGDQPRLEFALGSLLVGGQITFEEASKVSGYFNWPSTWIWEGIFSNTLGITSFEAPVFLMVMTYLLLGLGILATSRRISPTIAPEITMISVLAYAVINPYKILHLCPQIYALTLFTLSLSVLLKMRLTRADLIILFVLSAAIITAHPLTSLVVAGVMVSIVFYALAKRIRESRNLIALAVSVVIFLVLWNLNYENLLRSVLDKLFSRPTLQSLPPVAGAPVYRVDIFFRLMIVHRYTCTLLLALIGLLSVILLLSNRTLLKIRVLAVITGALVGSLALNFIPGSFFHRLLYFASTIIVMMTPISVAGIPRVLKILHMRKILHLQKQFKSLLFLFLLLSPFLSHLALLEFLTNNNPVATITSPYECATYMFLAKYCGFKYDVSAPSGALGFYFYVLNFNRTVDSIHLHLTSSAAARATVLPSDYPSAEKFVKAVYGGRVFVMSPREKFVLYLNTLFHDFQQLDLYINCNYCRIYDNGLFRTFTHAF